MAELETLGDTLYARLRGPEGADGGGGVFTLEGAFEMMLVGLGMPENAGCRGARGEMEGCDGGGRVAFGPIGAARFMGRCACGNAGDAG